MQIAFEPDIGGYSVGSMMMKPASQSGPWPGRSGWRGTRRSRAARAGAGFRRPSPSRASVCICSKTVAPAGGSTPPVTTFPTSPPAWHPTTVIVRRARIGASIPA